MSYANDPQTPGEAQAKLEDCLNQVSREVINVMNAIRHNTLMCMCSQQCPTVAYHATKELRGLKDRVDVLFGKAVEAAITWQILEQR